MFGTRWDMLQRLLGERRSSQNLLMRVCTHPGLLPHLRKNHSLRPSHTLYLFPHRLLLLSAQPRHHRHRHPRILIGRPPSGRHQSRHAATPSDVLTRPRTGGLPDPGRPITHTRRRRVPPGQSRTSHLQVRHPIALERQRSRALRRRAWQRRLALRHQEGGKRRRRTKIRRRIS